MKRTGIFYHEVCGKKAYFSLAMSVEEGFKSLERENILKEPNISLFSPDPVSEELIFEVHTEEMIEQVRRSGYYETSIYSVGCNLMASEKVVTGEIDNALVFMGVGGHHSSRNSFWGGCFFNTEAIPVIYLRKKFEVKKIAIIDTDTHHADGTMDIFKHDEDLLYICFCGGYWGLKEESKSKICLPHGDSDEEEIENVRRKIPERIEKFKPDLIYWMLGFDTHRDSYGTATLTEKSYPRLAKIIKEVADEICYGKLVVVNGCNAPAHVTTYSIPRIVDCLAELEKYKD
jgi:acetoin utilization deacetylase AcuC-like enzyme